MAYKVDPARVIAEIVDATDSSPVGTANFDVFHDEKGYLPAFTVPVGDYVWFEWSFSVTLSNALDATGYVSIIDDTHSLDRFAPFFCQANKDDLVHGVSRRYVSDGLPFHTSVVVLSMGVADNGATVFGAGDQASYFRAWTQPA